MYKAFTAAMMLVLCTQICLANPCGKPGKCRKPSAEQGVTAEASVAIEDDGSEEETEGCLGEACSKVAAILFQRDACEKTTKGSCDSHCCDDAALTAADCSAEVDCCGEEGCCDAARKCTSGACKIAADAASCCPEDQKKAFLFTFDVPGCPAMQCDGSSATCLLGECPCLPAPLASCPAVKNDPVLQAAESLGLAGPSSTRSETGQYSVQCRIYVENIETGERQPVMQPCLAITANERASVDDASQRPCVTAFRKEATNSGDVLKPVITTVEQGARIELTVTPLEANIVMLDATVELSIADCDETVALEELTTQSGARLTIESPVVRTNKVRVIRSVRCGSPIRLSLGEPTDSGPGYTAELVVEPLEATRVTRTLVVPYWIDQVNCELLETAF